MSEARTRTEASAFARQVAATAWCADTTSHIEMNAALAEEFAKILDGYREALIWCGGSADFNEGGQAREGWLKICRPLINGKLPSEKDTP